MDFLFLFAALLAALVIAYLVRRNRKHQRMHTSFEISWVLENKILETGIVTGTDQLLAEDAFMAQARKLAEEKGWTKVETGPQREKIGKRGRRITVKVTGKNKEKSLVYRAVQV